MSEIARNLVKGPATGLKVVAWIGIAFALLTVLINVLGVLGAIERAQEGAAALFAGTLGFVSAVLGLGVGVFQLVAAGKMTNLVDHKLCMIASITAMVPCFSCWLVGLPIGIWALVVLSKPEVKSAFTA